jgi:hypothetical protein
LHAAFQSDASNLVQCDTNRFADIFATTLNPAQGGAAGQQTPSCGGAGGGLPTTGDDVLRTALVGVAFLTAGWLMLLAVRRRPNR